MYTLEQIAALTGARKTGEGDVKVNWLLTDSRSLCFPEETLFFALKSRRNDGRNYLSDLYRRGVRAFVVEEGTSCPPDCPEAVFLSVSDPLKALQRLAERHRESFSLPVVGITGSNGKTVVKEWLYQLLTGTYTVARSPRSYNSQIGVPLSVWSLTERADVALFEAGISMEGEMDALQAIIQPTIGVITNIGAAHQENFASPEDKCLEKLKLFRESEVLVYCADDACVTACLPKSAFAGRRVDWSRKREDAAIFIRSTDKADGHTQVIYRWQGEEGNYTLPFVDEASVEDSVHCLAVALWLGVEREVIASRMAQLEPVAMRLEVKEGRNGCTLINDSYNSDFNSLDIALDFMNRRPDCAGKRRTLILSDIYQYGEQPDVFYARVAQLVNSRGVEKFIGVGTEVVRMRPHLQMEAHFFASCDELLRSSESASLRNELILIKGARAFRFDELTEQLELKVHETILEVNLNAVVDNLNYYRSFMRPDTKMVCMVKASAYGAGSVEVAKTLQDHRVDYLAVAVADEGVDLRKAGITGSILIMNPEMTTFKTLFEYELEPEVYSFRLLDALIHAAEKEGITHFPVHIKLDTGMHRLGFDPQHDMERLIARLQSQTAVIPRSVFSHFVGSDSDDFDAFSAHQYVLFLQGSRRLQAAFPHKILRHICNSAGIEHFPERHLDMVRLGLGLYGINSRNNEVIHHVSTLKTTILQIHDVPATDTVGYSRKGRLTRDSRIAALPIGYADGLNRKLGNGNAYCLVNGCKAPYVGNICMDVCMIDVTDIDCKEGDTAIIFGPELPVTVLSDAVGTIPYEILTSVSNRVKRVYYQD
ncbi:MAG: bifunctional UDP-N-acetylmuramoyl-tripeptide:D-alanyl-D-alanine ligase/alanine racemase [Clostridium sp.]|nr:bifunctional UDP-N-acetylmuramoyl-tripeptide:D-alanyl-D-alanine ligase/alanine racemase [Clostridium sp.]